MNARDPGEEWDAFEVGMKERGKRVGMISNEVNST